MGTKKTPMTFATGVIRIVLPSWSEKEPAPILCCPLNLRANRKSDTYQSKRCQKVARSLCQVARTNRNGKPHPNDKKTPTGHRKNLILCPPKTGPKREWHGHT